MFGDGREELMGRDIELLVPERFRAKHSARMVIAGLLNKEIGAELGISLRTTKSHRARVMQTAIRCLWL